MDEIGKRVSIFFAFGNHPADDIPWVPIFFHRFDDLDDGFHVFDILFNVGCFKFINLLFLLEFVNSRLLIFFDLVILFPGKLLKNFLFLVLTFLVMFVVLFDCLIEVFLFHALKFVFVFYATIRGILKILRLFILLFRLHKQISFVL